MHSLYGQIGSVHQPIHWCIRKEDSLNLKFYFEIPIHSKLDNSYPLTNLSVCVFEIKIHIVLKVLFKNFYTL